MNKNKKLKKVLLIILFILLAIILIGIIGSLGKDSNNSANQSDENSLSTDLTPTPIDNSKQDDSNQNNTTIEPTKDVTKEPTPTVEASTETFEVELTAGNYIAGIDFPSGKYDLTALSGYGNVFTQDASLNEIMGIKGDDYSITTYKNAKFNEGTILSIKSNLKIRLSSNDIYDSSLKTRTNDATEVVELSSGNYVAGDDFVSGTYDILVLDGFGNVMTADGELNEIFNVEKDDMSIQEFKNYTFTDGDELTLSGVSVKLVPSK